MHRWTHTAAAVAIGLLVVLCAACAAGSDAAFRFAILSDRTGGHTDGVYPQVIEEISLLNPDFVITVGDHIEGYGEDFERVGAEWDTLLEFLDRLEVPVYLTPGNHDIWSAESEEVYQARTGRRPYYSFDYENTHFVVLDVSRIESWDDFQEEQLEWLTADLGQAEAENLFVFLHKPLWAQTLVLGKPDPMHSLFLEHGVDAVFCGHLHNYFTATYDGIDYTVLGSSGGAIFHSTEQPVARGEFFQFGWVTVGSPGYELAIVDLGGIYPQNVVTTESLEEIDEIESELVTVVPLIVGDAAIERATVAVKIRNTSNAILEDQLVWDVPEAWSVSPARAEVAIAPGDAGVIEFEVSNSGQLFPVPRLSCEYPLRKGGCINIDLPLDVKRTVSAKRVDATPSIDGEILEEGWMDVAPATVLYPAYEDAIIQDGTEFRFAYDRNNLYLSAVCYDEEIDGLAASIQDRDGAVYTEDCVGFFFQPHWDDMVVYQIYFNALGTPFDQRISFDENMYYETDLSWDGEYEVATKRTEDRWTVEVRIPLDEFGADIKESPAWGLNFRRKQQRTGAAADWHTPIDYDPRTFGEIRFE
jgi:predicted phosphohydrolase